MKKATLALIIGTTLSSVINSAYAVTLVDAPINYDPVFTTSESTLLENTAITVYQHDSAINSLQAQADAAVSARSMLGNQIDVNKQAIANLGSTTKTALINNAAENEEQNKALNVLNGQIQVTGTQVEVNKQSIENLDSTTKTALINNATENEEQNKALNELDGQIQVTGAYAKSRTDAAIANAENNKVALAKTNQAVAAHSAELANHESRIDALEANTGAGNSFARLKNQVDDNRQRASAGIAGVAAMANIPQVTQGATFSVGAGAGTTDGESALAVGFSARATENTVIKASVSNDSQQNFVVGAGAAYQW
ncbi:YadA-like family protein [Cedecea davisae]|uniref:YadA-like family protein n=3 Tax=Cedecea davisae TaxID=158484 RepID=A0ABS6DCN1_9ENTR|nr:YadA C-terminal domain-containing protein [Cedecea davisae]MBU4680944.1 YadA-like family protein [Cedecea davisae]